MVIYEILLISIGLSLDVFAYALYKGAMMSEISRSSLIKIGGIFILWQMTSLLLGHMVTNIHLVKESAQQAAVHWRYISVFIFWGLGLYMIVKGRRQKIIFEHKEDKIKLSQIIVWACITSIDTFLAGIGFGFFRTSFLMTALIIGIITAASVIAGVYSGYWMGCQSKNKIVTLGGCILLLGGIELLIRGIN